MFLSYFLSMVQKISKNSISISFVKKNDEKECAYGYRVIFLFQSIREISTEMSVIPVTREIA